jgi:hypothetical protein
MPATVIKATIFRDLIIIDIFPYIHRADLNEMALLFLPSKINGSNSASPSVKGSNSSTNVLDIFLAAL